MDECPPCGLWTAGTTRIPSRYVPQLIRAPVPDHSLSRRSRATGSWLPASAERTPSADGLTPDGRSHPVPSVRDAEDSMYAGMVIARFNPIGYEPAGACHDEPSSSGDCPVARATGAGRTPSPGQARDRATRATGSGWDPEGRDPADRWAGKAAFGASSIGDRRGRVMTSRHQGPRRTGQRGPRMGRLRARYGFVVRACPGAQPWFEKVGMNR